MLYISDIGVLDMMRADTSVAPMCRILLFGDPVWVPTSSLEMLLCHIVSFID